MTSIRVPTEISIDANDIEELSLWVIGKKTKEKRVKQIKYFHGRMRRRQSLAAKSEA